jgi:hypothetical protein
MSTVISGLLDLRGELSDETNEQGRLQLASHFTVVIIFTSK